MSNNDTQETAAPDTNPPSDSDSGWPAAHDEYERLTEEVTRAFEDSFTWHSAWMQFAHWRSSTMARILRRPVPLRVSYRTWLALALGLGGAWWLRSTSNNTWSIGEFALVTFIFGAIAFGLMTDLPQFLRNLVDRMLWRWVAICFAVIGVPIAVTEIDNALSKRIVPQPPSSDVWLNASTIVFFSLISGWAIRYHTSPISRRAKIWLAVASVPLGLLQFGVFIIVWAFLLKYAGQDPDAYFASQSRLIWPAGILIYIVLTFGLLWIGLSWLRRKALPTLRQGINTVVAKTRSAWLKLVKLETFITQDLHIHRLYVLIWKFWVPSALVALLSSLDPVKFRWLTAMGTFFSISILVFLLLLTLQYMFIPQELVSVRVNVPNYIARPVVRAAVVFGLLFIAWWMVHSVVMLNLSNWLLGENARGFRFVDSLNSANPQAGDFAYYAFALMTNAPYGDLQPVHFDARLYAMFVTATGLLLLVGFVGVALSYAGGQVVPSKVAPEVAPQPETPLADTNPAIAEPPHTLEPQKQQPDKGQRRNRKPNHHAKS